ncbi:MAG: peptidase M4 [Candidatus Kapabacteria bacterium]|jgi:hypothetical protein|nr:peptidase M4 [Candidatus Kapabacteria bacterium]
MKFRTLWIRKTHRYLGVIIGIQFVFWTASGLFFAWNDIDAVHGDTLMAHQHPSFSLDTVNVVPFGTALTALKSNVLEATIVQSVSVREILHEPMIELRYLIGKKEHYALVNARTGAFRPPITAEEARMIAEEDFAPEAAVQSVEYITDVEPTSEYREKPLPAYRVTFDHESGTHIYISAERGIVTSRRNSRWRAWDFLWAFHILDFQTRDNIHNWLLRGMSALAVLTVVSGFLLWGFTSPTLRKWFAAKP